MNFRYARHTNDIKKIEKFYTEIIGLEKLASFENHKNYNGIFLGFSNQNWHLEFTTSKDKTQSKYDEDDILVFYQNSEYEIDQITKRIKKNQILIENSKNPYWNENGIQVSDPDNHKIIFALENIPLNSNDNLTIITTKIGIATWNDLLKFVKNLPYGRNSNRKDFTLVLQENKGTCSSKHAFLKTIADLNSVKNVKLILGMFKMNSKNNPKIKSILERENLEFIPEAHCYLKINNIKLDLTNSQSDFHKIENDIISEIEIQPEQVNEYKIEYHKNYMKSWLKNQGFTMTFEKIWNIREECIKELEG